MRIVFLKIFVYITNGELCTHDMVQLPTCEGDIRISQNLMKTLKNHISWMDYPFLSKFWMFIAKIYSTFNEFIFFSEYSVLLTLLFSLVLSQTWNIGYNMLGRVSRDNQRAWNIHSGLKIVNLTLSQYTIAITLILWLLKCVHFVFNVCSLKHDLTDQSHFHTEVSQ